MVPFPKLEPGYSVSHSAEADPAARQRHLHHLWLPLSTLSIESVVRRIGNVVVTVKRSVP